MNPTGTGIAAPQKQTMRFSEDELDIMRNSLKDNDLLLKIVRKRLLQMDLEETDQALLLKLMPEGSQLFNLIKKTVHPELDGDAPFFQMVDLQTNADVKDKPLEIACVNILAREIMAEYLTEVFDKFHSHEVSFKNKFKELTSDVYNKLKDNEQELCASFLARNTLVSHIDFQLNQLLILANTKKVTQEELEKRNEKKSTK